MTNCKTILIYLAGMVTIVAVLVGQDLYQRKMDSFCFNTEPQEMTAGMK
jgi:hypothetical protein